MLEWFGSGPHHRERARAQGGATGRVPVTIRVRVAFGDEQGPVNEFAAWTDNNMGTDRLVCLSP